MTTWVLILTLASYSGPVAIATVSGFTAMDACTSAGAAWLKETAEKKHATRSALCVEQPAAFAPRKSSI